MLFKIIVHFLQSNNKAILKEKVDAIFKKITMFKQLLKKMT